MDSGNYTISSTPVKYPYKAYPSQIGMIDRVIKALQRNQNCLIESPTGSGKSLALLCAVLAWRQKEYERVETDVRQQAEAENRAVRIVPLINISSDSSGSAPSSQKKRPLVVDLDSEEVMFLDCQDDVRFVDPTKVPSPTKKQRDLLNASVEKTPSRPLTEEDILDRIWEAKKRIPKIYFGTRTHKQLAQLIRELKKTQYADVKMTILASRDQTCINPAVRAEKDRSEACRRKLNPNSMDYAISGGCQFHAKWKKQFQKAHVVRGYIRREQQSGSSFACGNVSGAWDIEDLVSVGSTHGFCPHFAASSTLLVDAELIFCPYNYLIDPIVRSSVRLDLTGQVILLDEAHNIEDVCRDASSFSFTRSEFSDAAEIFHWAGELDNYPPAPAAMCLEKICNAIIRWLDNVLKSEKMKLQSHMVQSCEWLGSKFVNELAEMGLSMEAGERIAEKVKEIVDDEEEGSEFGRRLPQPGEEERPSVAGGAMKTMDKLVLFLKYFYGSRTFDEYRVCVKQEFTGGTQKHQYTQFSSKRQSGSQNTVTWNLWCMNPALAFKDMGEKAKSIILASGTLAPMQTFQTELGTEFKLQLEATHVLPKDRMFVASVGRGPTGKNLRVTYQNTSEWSFQDEIGQLLVDICDTVPFGVLCFFPSYKLLETLENRWNATGVISLLSKRKVIVVEPKLSENLHAIMEQFYEAVHDPSQHGPHCTGALFMAVCRGKVSEGLDFADDNARAVVTIGIPYPNFSGFEVMQKREYNNERVRQGQSTLTGDQWYEIQAYRALNQALGRCLRHRQDWGALILIDERFGLPSTRRYCDNLSRWIRENIRHYDDFGKAKSDLAAFTQRLLSDQQENAPRQLQF